MGGLEKVFVNHSDAEVERGQFFKEYLNDHIAVSGVPKLARSFCLDFSRDIVGKLAAKSNDEKASSAFPGVRSFYLLRLDKLNKSTMQEVISNQTKEIHRRIQRFRTWDSLPDMDDSTVFFGDIATGSEPLSQSYFHEVSGKQVLCC